jgi:hypothetical protein
MFKGPSHRCKPIAAQAFVKKCPGKAAKGKRKKDEIKS